MSSGFMSGVIAAIASVLYFLAPFVDEEKRAFQFRLISEALFALSFLYIGTLAGVSYYGFLLLSGLFQKRIETSRTFGIVYGVIAASVTVFLNNTGMMGVLLGISLILVFLKLDERSMMSFTSYLDLLTSLILASYSFSVHAWVSFVFALILMLFAIAGLISAVKLIRAGGMDAAEAEERAYQKKRAQEKQEREKKEKAKKIRRRK